MARTDNFRKQHDDLLSIARELGGLLSNTLSGNEAVQIRTVMARLRGKVNVHLAMEDKALYPALLASSNDELKSLAKSYSQEMGTIGGQIEAYMAKWSTAKPIEAKAAEFSAETKSLLKVLAARIQKENTHLYMLADKLV